MQGRIVTISMDVVVSDEHPTPYSILRYLNDKLRNDPGFFGELGLENIVNIQPSIPYYSTGRSIGDLARGHTLE